MFQLLIFLSSVLLFVTVRCQDSAAVGRPEIVGDILPTVTQINAEADLICAVVNDKIDDANVIEWVKARSASGQPIFISENDKVVDSAQQIIEETKKFKYEVRREKQESRDLYILTIRGLAEEDAGDYICRIRITGPNSPPSSWPQKVAQLTVQIAPVVRPSGDAVYQLSVGQSINITCDAYGIPYPNITWKREDGSYLQNGGFRSRGRHLQLSNIQERDRGNYMCIADNNVRPPANYKVQVLIYYSPRCHQVQDTVGQAQNRRFDVKMDCICGGYPTPTVTWQKLTNQGRVDIRDDDKYDLSKTFSTMIYDDQSWYTLKVKNVQANDYTEYYCMAKNPYGKNETTFRIFETMECQGANCPSIGTGGGSAVTFSVTSLVLSAISVMFYL